MGDMKKKAPILTKKNNHPNTLPGTSDHPSPPGREDQGQQLELLVLGPVLMEEVS